jgi:hypothetical protein
MQGGRICSVRRTIWPDVRGLGKRLRERYWRVP